MSLRPSPDEFATLFDRHATVIRDYLVRRVGPQPDATVSGEFVPPNGSPTG